MDDDATIGDEVVGAVVVDFADDVDGVASRSIGGDGDGGGGLVGMIDKDFGGAYLGLLPPKEGEVVGIGVGRTGCIEAYGAACLGFEVDGSDGLVVAAEGKERTTAMTDDDERVVVATPFGGPLHAGDEVVEFVGIEAAFVFYRGGSHWLLPTDPCGSEGIGGQSADMVACPPCLLWVVGVGQSVGHCIEETGRVAFYAPLVGGICLSECPTALYQLFVLLPGTLAQFALLLPCTFIPNEPEVVGKLATQPLV